MRFISSFIPLICQCRFLFQVLFLAWIIACLTGNPAHAGVSAVAVGKANGREVPKWPSCDGHCTTQNISFVHVSDLHAQYNLDKNGSSPVGRIRGYYEQVKKENPFTLFTNAGDDYEKGSIAEELSEGKTTRQVVHALRYDVRTLGNHDFAWGFEELLRYSNDPSAVVLAANVKLNSGKKGFYPERTPGWTDFSVITVGCVRIGFLGLVTKPVGENDQPYDGPYYRHHPELQTNFNFAGIARDIIARHRQEVDVLVLISHLGLQEDIVLAEETSGIDLLLGGHTHSITKTPLRVKNTTIVHTGAYGENIGRMDIEYDIHNKRIAESRFHLIANRPGEVPDDEHFERRVADILKPYEQELYKTIADVNQNQKKETMALIAARAAVETLKVDAAFISEDMVWQEWNKGELTQQDILNAFRVERQPAASPGHSSLYRMEVEGRDLIHAIAVLRNSAYWGPSRINPKTSYTIALQKLPALNQKEFFGKSIGYSQPKPAAELWETVVSFAMGQKSAGLSLNQGLQDRNSATLVSLYKDLQQRIP